MGFKSVNPATEETIAVYEEMSRDVWEAALIETQRAFRTWRETSFAERSKALKRLAQALRRRQDEFARLMTLEMGKPITQARSEVEKCAWCCDYFAEHGEGFLSDEIILTQAKKSFVSFQPLGIILGVMPWNFPFWQVFRFLAPTLMAGDAIVLKHASNVSGCALAIEEVCREAGLPQNLFRTLLVSSGQIPEIIGHPLVRAVTLTGSTAAGQAVAATAGRHLKKAVLELGGSDPYVILPDADLAHAAQICASSRTLNTGQSCIAAKRFIVVNEVYEEFERLFVECLSRYQPGDPLQDTTTLGPLARRDLRDELHAQVEKSVARGARCLLGGKRPSGSGAFYPATLLANVQPGMPAYDEELFGPVASLIRATNADDAIRIANDSPYGLGGAIFTRDLSLGERLAARELEAGCVFVNDFVKSDPRLPFGGVKESGYGRELSIFGCREFVNIKTVVVA